MLEAKRLLEEQGAKTIWLNVQTVRNLGAFRAFLTVASRLCDLPVLAFGSKASSRLSVTKAADLQRKITEQLDKSEVERRQVEPVVSRVQQMLQYFCTETQIQVFVFLDDVHYLPADVPSFLDMVHGITRDNPIWLKLAGIRHQMRWFTSNPPTGLQVGHDASEINLDITLQEPKRAKSFLQEVLAGYIDECGAGPRRGFLSTPAVDRLVLASGGVPRDFTTLCWTAIQSARKRPKARATGVQDVNEAAGLAAKAKLQELEDDAASAVGGAQSILAALNVVRHYLLSEKQITYLRVDFLDKEQYPDEYTVVQSLMDLRMLHLVNASVSHEQAAGRRSEVYMLDLSQYSGARLKQKLRVLDFEGNHLVLKRTRSKEPIQIGDTARKLTTILRRGPLFDLSLLSKPGSGAGII